MHRPAHCLLLAMLLPIALLGCQTPGSPPREVLPNIHWQPQTNHIQIDGSVALQRGILEYIAVVPGGKEYESVFRAHCRPSHLHQVMLMAHYQIADVPPTARGDYSTNPTAAPDRPPGAPTAADVPPNHWDKPNPETCIRIDVDVQTAPDQWQRHPLEHFLIDRRTKRPPADLRWAFTGSFFTEPRDDEPAVYAADWELSVIALWYDPTALLNVVDDHGNPYRAPSAGFEVNPATIPPRDNPIRLILYPTPCTD